MKEEQITEANASTQTPIQHKIDKAVLVLPLTIMLIAGSIISGLYFLKSELYKATKDNKLIIAEAANTNKNTIANLQLEINSQQKKLEQQEQLIEKIIKKQDKNKKRQYKPHPKATNWLASEALFLANIAERKINLEEDKATAIHLLQEIKTIINKIKKPITIKINQIIDDDIQTIINSKQETNDTYIKKINTIEKKVKDIKWITFDKENIQTKENKQGQQLATDETLDSLEKFKKYIMFLFSDFIIIHNKNKGTEILLPDQIWYTKEQVRHNLEIMEIALYKKKPEVYKKSINKIIDLLNSHAELNNEMTNDIFNEINTLSKITIETESHKLQLRLTAELENLILQQEK